MGAVALPLAMTLNELCTNASKYGALSVPQGRVLLSSKIDDAKGLVHVTWREEDGPSVAEPSRMGFGMQLIEQSLPAQLNGKAQVRFDPHGIVCDLEFPFSAIAPSTAISSSAGA